MTKRNFGGTRYQIFLMDIFFIGNHDNIFFLYTISKRWKWQPKRSKNKVESFVVVVLACALLQKCWGGKGRAGLTGAALQRLQQSIQLQLQQRIIARHSFLKSNTKKLEQTKITSGERNWENKKTFGSWCFDCDKKICRECGYLRGRRAHNLRCGVSWGWGWSVRFFGLSAVGRKQLQDARKTIPSWFSDIVANNKTMVITNNNKPKQVSVWMILGPRMGKMSLFWWPWQSDEYSCWQAFQEQRFCLPCWCPVALAVYIHQIVKRVFISEVIGRIKVPPFHVPQKVGFDRNICLTRKELQDLAPFCWEGTICSRNQAPMPKSSNSTL